MKIKAGVFSGAIFAVMGASMAMPSQMRMIAQFLIIFSFLFLSLALFSKGRWRELDKNASFIVALFSINSIFSVLTIFYEGYGLKPIAVQLTALVNIYLAVLSLQYFNKAEFFRSYANTSFIIFLLSFAMFIVGYEFFNNMNAYGLILAPVVIHLAHFANRKRLAAFVVVFGIIVCNFVEARLAIAMMVLAFLTAFLPANRLYFRASGFALVAFAIGINIYYTFNFNIELNFALTNRVLLWNAFGDIISERIWIGHGYIGEGAIDNVVDQVRIGAGRGVNDRYGTQSLYVLYLYQTGAIGLAIILFIFFFAMHSTQTYFWPLAVMMIASISETVYVGTPSLIGIPLMLFLVCGLLERHNWGSPNFRPAT